jgi:hypothetical protein
MTNVILIFFRIILYLSLFGNTAIGYLVGVAWFAPLATYVGATYGLTYGASSAHFAGFVGGLIGFASGVILVGYGLVLLSINDHLARLSAGAEVSPSESLSRSRVEPQMRA